MSKVAFYDTECYGNYWLLKFKQKEENTFTFRLLSGHSFDSITLDLIRFLFSNYTTVSFNGNYYDVPMINAALSGCSVEQLKWLNDRIIIEKAKPWQLTLSDWAPKDHIDVMEVAPGQGGQKQYAGRIHYKTMRDLPYDPSSILTHEQMIIVDQYCENDLGQLEAIYDELQPQINQRIALSKRYGIDLRSKSDAQLAEAVLKLRCEQAVGRKIYKNEIDWNLKFKFDVPAFIHYENPQLKHALELIKSAIFRIQPPASMRGDGEKGKCVVMPPELEALDIAIGSSVYKMGIGGLHSKEKHTAHVADETYVLRDADVARYYPQLIINSGKWPKACGPSFLSEYKNIADERLDCKHKVKQLKNRGDTSSQEYITAKVGDDGGKIMINGTFGKTGSPFSILFAPEMLIQTTLSGQLSLLMLIEWHEHYGIQVVSANTDGIVIKCRRDMLHISDSLIKEWEIVTGLEMEFTEYKAIYSRDVNNYFAIKTDGDVKRKGEYSKAGMVEKKNPDVEICSDAVAKFLLDGIPLLYTISACRDIRKFVTIQKVNGGGVKLWGEGPRKGALVRDMLPILQSNSWNKAGRRWQRGTDVLTAQQAYESCFKPQLPEFLGKVVRWYYGTQSPGPIVYGHNGNTVGMSYGATPCMTLPDEFPDDIDYNWYLAKSESILTDVGFK